MSARKEVREETTAARETIDRMVLHANIMAGGDGPTAVGLLLMAYIEAAAGGLGMTDDQMMRSLQGSLRNGAADPARKQRARVQAAAAMGPAKGSA